MEREFFMKQFTSRLSALTLAALLACAPAALADGLADGTYSGLGNGNNGAITVDVTVAGGAITAVTVTDHSETAGICDAAIEKIPQEIVAANSADVDTVSGATNTSKGIIEAVKNALGETAAKESKEASLPTWYQNAPKNEASAEAHAPRVTTMANGVKVQYTPNDDRGWNNVYMDADNRGCNACHNLEDIVTKMETYHGVIYYKYPTTQTIATCLMCHSFYETPLRDTIHATHLGNAAFQAMNGSCNSCHYINGDGEYERWDYVKYDHLKGITDIAADDLQAEITYNQDQITPIENMYYKSPKVVNMEPTDWLTDDSQIIPDIYDQWTITVSGDVDNPFTMGLDELKEACGTVTQVMSTQCCINGVGQAMIYQAEVTGIPLERIFELAGVHDDVTTFNTVANDTYGTGGNCYPLDYDFVMENEGILVLEMNGQPLPAGQGYPCATWVGNTSSGNCVKYVTELIATKEENPVHYALTGYFVDPSTGETFSKPNIGVLSTYDGTIFPAGETIHLEGYADAWDEPIVCMEYSFDHGKTWTKVETPDNDSLRWTYWMMDFTPPATGSYLLRMRATSLMADGTERVSKVNTDFLINVQ